MCIRDRRNIVHSYKTGTLNNDLSSVTLGGTYTTKWTWSNTASYAKQIGIHNFDVLAGLEMYKEEQINFSAYKDGFLVETPEQMWPDTVSYTHLDVYKRQHVLSEELRPCTTRSYAGNYVWRLTAGTQ